MEKSKQYRNAPLIQVVSTLWWHVEKSNNFENSKLLSGILYPLLKKNYPNIQVLPVPSNKIHHSIFMLNEEKQYILEISLGEIKLSSVDENYSWNEFFEQIKFISETLISVLDNLISYDHLHAKLEYLDFFEFDFKNNEITDFLKSYLNISVESNIFKRLDSISFNLAEKIKDFGKSSMEINLGNLMNKKNGFIVHFTNDSPQLKVDISEIKSWFDRSHDICKSNFEKLIDGPIKEQLEYAE